MSQLVENPGLGQRMGAFQEAFVQHADLLRIEAVEAAYGIDLRGGLWHDGISDMECRLESII